MFLKASGGSIDLGYGTWHQRDYCRQYGQRVSVPYQAGDLLFFMDQGPEVPSHVGIASGDGHVIEETASFSANVVEVTVSPRWTADYVEGWRILLPRRKPSI